MQKDYGSPGLFFCALM